MKFEEKMTRNFQLIFYIEGDHVIIIYFDNLPDEFSNKFKK